MHVSIAIVGFRNPDDILTCLAAIDQLNHQNFEVVIWENGGDATYQNLVQTLPAQLTGGQPVQIFHSSENLGFAGGVNACFRASPDADAWWLLNPDTEPAPTALNAMLERLESGCDATGSTVFVRGVVGTCGGRWSPWLGRAVSLGNGSHTSELDTSSVEARQNYLSGCSILITRRFLEAVGPLREDYFLYCEEIEWCLRAAKRGMRLGYAPKAQVVHHQGTTMGDYHNVRNRGKISVYLMERNRILLTKDIFPWALPSVLIVGLPLLFWRYARAGAWKQILFGLQGVLAALNGERGKPHWFT